MGSSYCEVMSRNGHLGLDYDVDLVNRFGNCALLLAHHEVTNSREAYMSYLWLAVFHVFSH